MRGVRCSSVSQKTCRFTFIVPAANTSHRPSAAHGRAASGSQGTIAPATANVIAELAHGLANHPLAAIALATRAPILIAPAMNGKMWSHPATVENVNVLKSRGVEFIGPEEGMLACGYEGLGRLWKIEDIAFRAEFLLARQENLIA